MALELRGVECRTFPDYFTQQYEHCLRRTSFWINAEFFAVGLFAFFGTYLRVSLTNIFVNGYSGMDQSGPHSFIQLFYQQTYFLSVTPNN